ncbi:MAG: acetate--CoA ligase family protein [Planctomycetes bacterium]|nr:acetate--CoA ligase family protein [Planctomycetota bacterium]
MTRESRRTGRRASGAHSLDALFRPRSVAVVGASRQPGRIGREILRHLVEGGFSGPVYPVNPTTDVVGSMHCYPRVSAIPGEVDLAVIVVAASEVLDVVRDCAKKKVTGVVVISSGFAEVGGEGVLLQQRLVALCRQHGMRLVGPNCMGVLNTDPRWTMNATFAASTPESGGAAFLSQSGALGEAILADARSLGLGVSMFASIGNRADVTPADLLAYWDEDARTQQILLYLESFGEPERFMAVARRVARRKPILVVKSGRTARGAAAAVSHTGSLAGSEAAVDSLLFQCGVLRVDTMKDLFALAGAIQAGRFPHGRRVAVVTNAGGPAILATDALVAHGLEVGDLAAATRRRLRRMVPKEASVANPVDLIASADGARFDKVLGAVVDDPSVDMLLALFVSPAMIDSVEVARVFAAHARGTRKPMVCCLLGKAGGEEALEVLRAAGVPHYRFPEEAAAALAGLHRLQVLHGRKDVPAPQLDVDTPRARRVIRKALASGRELLKGAELGELLGCYGIPIVPGRIVRDRAEALRAAETLGFPLVAKVVAKDVVHKSDRGGVLLDLRTREELLDAYDVLEARFSVDHPEMHVLLQSMRGDGVEVFVGAATDPQFGRMLAFGLGGIHVEVLKDVVFRLHPITSTDAHEMLDGIRSRALLDGVRGKPAVDKAQLAEILLRVSRMLSDLPEIAELDLNPVLAAWTRGTSCVLDARVRLASVGARTDARSGSGTALEKRPPGVPVPRRKQERAARPRKSAASGDKS